MERKFPIYSNEQDITSLKWISVRDLSKVPAVAGVYILTNKETSVVEYIGQSSNMRYRIAGKEHPAYIRGLHLIKYLKISNKDIRYYTEYRSIEFLKPTLNKRSGAYAMGNQDNLTENYNSIFG